MVHEDLSDASLQDLVRAVRDDWKNVSVHAEPYLQAIENSGAQQPSDPVIHETADAQIARFLGHATGWTGPRAREVKAEMRKRIERYEATGQSEPLS